MKLEGNKGKVNPFANSFRAKVRPEEMPFNLVHGSDGFPRVILTEATGSSAEVRFPSHPSCNLCYICPFLLLLFVHVILWGLFDFGRREF